MACARSTPSYHLQETFFSVFPMFHQGTNMIPTKLYFISEKNKFVPI